MPSYSVKFPDGYVQQFDGPANLSDTDAITRAKQERDIKEGRVQTTFAGGFAKKLGEDTDTTGALLNGFAMVPGLAPIGMLSAPIAKGIQYGTQKLTGQNPQAPDAAELGGLAARTAVGMIPAGMANVAEGLAARVVPHQIPSVAGPAARTIGFSPVSQAAPNMQWVKGLKGDGVIPWAVREGAQAAGQGAANYIKPWANYAPALRDAIMKLMQPSSPQP